MKIEQLEIKGFRSLRDVCWRPGDLNVIIGPNGSGKSNLLHALELIYASEKSRLNEFVLAEGGMEPLVWDGRNPTMSFMLENRLNSEEHELLLPYSIEADSLLYEFELERQNESSSYKFLSERLAGHNGNKVANYLTFNPQNAILHTLVQGKEYVIQLELEPRALETGLSKYGDGVASPGIILFRRFVHDWIVYKDIDTDKEAVMRQAAVTRVEKRVAPDGKNLIPVLHTLYTGDRDFKAAVNDAMRAAFGNDFDELIFPPAADQRVQMRIRWKTLKREQSAADLSDGTLRFLFLLAALGTPDPPTLIAIDEPETGLHPSMLPIIAEFAADAALRTQVILTTHSDTLLDAFGETKPTTTVAKWENGETQLKVLDGDDLSYWLREYTLGSLFRSGELEAMP